jgi:L-lactate utilization protein LutB
MKGYDFTNLKNNLIKKGYVVKTFENKELAVKYLEEEITCKTVGFGGSVTLTELNLFDALSKNNQVIWHGKMPDGLSVMEVRTKAARADVYISSVNGISENGDIINIDYTGNRVAAISYGPKKVYLIIGNNKVAPTFELALYRARNIASPLNAKRLNRNTPCAIKGDKCYDCNSPDRICRNLSVLWQKPAGAEYEIILINEKLGY